VKYWWVNQNQTYRHEVPGGYLWSPKTRADGALNPFYEFMREVSPGDLIFSFCNTHIRAIGIAQSTAYEAPKPMEFGNVGAYWDRIGWRVKVHFTELLNVIRPMDHMHRLGSYLPKKYSPLRPNGYGQQNIYLTEVPDLLAHQILDIIGTEGRAIAHAWTASAPVSEQPFNGQVEWEEHQVNELLKSAMISDTEKQAIVMARRGQGLFRKRVTQIERRCRVTGVTAAEFLRASHAKPWRDSNNEERLDGENGLLLTPDVDLLFDRGFISFENNGDVLVSPVADRAEMLKMGLLDHMLENVGTFTSKQRQYLDFHRDLVFLRANVKRM
jgi:putative restriction endonuclease